MCVCVCVCVCVCLRLRVFLFLFFSLSLPILSLRNAFATCILRKLRHASPSYTPRHSLICIVLPVLCLPLLATTIELSRLSAVLLQRVMESFWLKG